MSSQKSVLVVEDEEAFADNLLTYLRRRAYVVRLARTGAAAVARAAGLRHILVKPFSLDDLDRLLDLPLWEIALAPAST
jgi:CheY-like chemotaxis protein